MHGDKPFKWPPEYVGIPRESGTADQVIINGSRVNDGGDDMLIDPGEAENVGESQLSSGVEDQSSQRLRTKYVNMPVFLH